MLDQYSSVEEYRCDAAAWGFKHNDLDWYYSFLDDGSVILTRLLGADPKFNG